MMTDTDKVHAGNDFNVTQKRWRFLRKQSKVIFAWMGGAAVIGVLGWILLFHTLNKQIADIDVATRVHVAAMSRGYAEQLARMLEAVDQTILHVRYEWNLTSGKLRLDMIPDEGLFPPASLFFVAVIDRHGDVLTSTIGDSERLNVSDKSYFTAHTKSTTDKLYFAPPTVTHTVGANVLQFSRRVVDNDGNFQGVVLAAVAPKYLTSSYDMNALGTNGFLGIVGNDHAVRVTRIGETVHTAAVPAFSNTPPFLSEKGTELLNGEQWFSDKRSRYVAWEPVKGYPIFAITGLDEKQVYAPHEAYRRRAIIAASALTSLLGLITIIATLSSLRLAWRKEEFETVRTAYRMATEDGNEGFYIARPVKDEIGAILDFDIIDCNQRGAAFFKLRHDELVGRRISRSRFGMVLKERQTMLWEAFESGASQAEVEVPEFLDLGPTWLHVKAVRVDEEIAITLYDMSSTKAHIKELERREHVDSLTGLFNRHWVRTYLPEVLEKAKSSNDMLAVLHLDLDGFKAINDAMGHACGDELLRAAADRLCAVVRPQDNVIRATSDEFLILLRGLPDSREAAMVAERAVAAFKDGFGLSQGYHRIGVSIGISIFPQDAADADNLLAYADIAMFSAKKGGKGTYRFYDPHFYEAMRMRFETEKDLRRAIEHDEFVMYYQPRVNIETGTTSSMESLVRWTHPKRGLVNPTEFVPLAEETGLVVGMGSLIIDKVCRQIGEWKKGGQPVVPVSINVSPRQFTDSDVVALFRTAIEKYDINPDLVEIEVTESSMMGDDERVLQTLSRLQAMGIKLLVDDFGTGYSSLSQLQRMDFDVLKVDRSFTCQIDRTNEGNVFVKAIITMAHALGMTVVAEGVENEEQLRILKSLACDEIQGFYISRPLPPSERQPILPRYFLRSVA
ncbi:EAL domain-containing protein [Noviherbaspirillum saxi]|nr:EAL domain-containing protein [Noviherbaspirillum saxi]